MINRLSAKGRATMRCIRQVRMTPAPHMMNGFRPPTHLPRRMRTWTWTDLRVTKKDEDIGSVEPPIQSVIGPDGLRQFILFLLWMVNDFYSTIKKKHFDTLREKYQILVSIPIRLPFKYEKCYY